MTISSGKIPVFSRCLLSIYVSSPITTSSPQNTAPGLNMYSTVPLKYFLFLRLTLTYSYLKILYMGDKMDSTHICRIILAFSKSLALTREH